jgi:predicted  nucleic acid-binding Zn-ribbon protein
MSTTSSKISYQGSIRSKVGRSPLSQAGSSLTRITQIETLKQELEQEKNARLNLERELNELKKISTEISKHLDMVKTSKPTNAWPTPAAGVPIRH